jgi:hypothetical protein
MHTHDAFLNSIEKMTMQASRFAAKVPQGNQAARPGALKLRSASSHRSNAPGGPGHSNM